jgi:hypothetical protein
MSAAVTLSSALRTLERLRILTHVPPEMLAEAIFPIETIPNAKFPFVRLDAIVAASQYLEEVAHLLDHKMRKGQWKCVECGQDVWSRIFVSEDGKRSNQIRPARRDTHYCSQACRQKAFRKRKRVTASPLSGLDKPSPRDNSETVSNRLAVTPEAAS